MIYCPSKGRCRGVRSSLFREGSPLTNGTAPNTLKIEYALKYMNIPYKKEFISYPDIAEHHKSLKIQSNDPQAVKFECQQALL